MQPHPIFRPPPLRSKTAAAVFRKALVYHDNAFGGMDNGFHILAGRQHARWIVRSGKIHQSGIVFFQCIQHSRHIRREIGFQRHADIAQPQAFGRTAAA